MTQQPLDDGSTSKHARTKMGNGRRCIRCRARTRVSRRDRRPGNTRPAREFDRPVDLAIAARAVSGSALPRATGAANEKDGYGKSATVQVFVDGKRVSEPFVTLGSLTADDVEAMEIYRGVSELPMEAAGDGRAAIFIWTRYTPGSVLGNKKIEAP